MTLSSFSLEYICRVLNFILTELMGRATRWLKNLFGINRENRGNKENREKSNFEEPKSTKFPSENASRVLCHNPETIPPNISPAEAAWLQSFYTETDKEQNKHAIAVAAATAAAADAAVVAAQAAVAVVRLTSHGRGTVFGGGHQMWAALKIQTVFRGYLARKALRALKALVKLQAVVRGYLMRKQATATLHSMQALIRAQATVRSHKSRNFLNSKNEACRFQNRTRKSMERFDDTKSECIAPIHSRRLSSFFDATMNKSIDGSPKIVEMDTGRPKSRSRRTNTSISDFGDDPSFQTLSSPFPLPHYTPTRFSIPNHTKFRESDRGLPGEEYKFSTTHSTPRFANSCNCGTPKGVYDDNNLFLRQYGIFPNYMASTQSSKAKFRSHSAPKQRPEPGSRKKLSLSEMMESRNSLSGVRMQRSCSQAQDVISFKNAVMGKLQKSSESVSEVDRNLFQQKRW